MDAGSSGSILGFGSRFPYESVSSDRNVDHCVNRERPPARGCRLSPDAAPAESATLRYRRTERTALYIETQEGDVVRLRIKVRDAVNGSTRTDGSDNPTTELAVNMRSSVKIRFSVEGNLSADELAAIESVVTQAAELAEDFFTSGVQDAFATAAGLDIDGDTLAHVGLKLSVRERLTYSASGVYQLPPAGAPEAPTPPASAPVEDAPAPVAAPPAAEAPVGEVSAPPATPEEPAPMDTPAAEDAPVTVPTPTAPPATVAVNALATIAEFIRDLLEVLAAPPADGEGTTAASVDMSLRLRIFQSVVRNVAAVDRPAPGDTDSAAGAPLVADTLDALAARHQPLDTRA
jgi:hypothetical protein